MKINKVLFAVPLLFLLTGCQTLSALIPGGGDEPVVITEAEVPAVIQSTLEAGETLWQFSERTTGSGFNWEEIAVLNSIKDERKVDAGLVLMIPPELALEEFKNQ